VLKTPFTRLVQPSKKASCLAVAYGGIDGSVVADIVSGKPKNTGYNAFTGQYVDMLKAGVIDPAKVVRTALANAASIAGLLLTTDAMVSNFEDEVDLNGCL